MLDILVILLLIAANGVFSGAELAIISARRHRLEQLSAQGQRSALVALRLADSPNQFLSTVQIGITLIGILSGAVGGATVAQRLSGWLEQVPLLNAYSDALSFGPMSLVGCLPAIQTHWILIRTLLSLHRLPCCHRFVPTHPRTLL